MTKLKEHPGLLLVRVPSGLSPATSYDDERLQRYAMNSNVEATIRQNRSHPQNRLYWVVLGIIADNNEVWTRAEQIHENIKRALGYTETTIDFDGVERERVKSTAFTEMDNAAFKEYFQLAMELIRLHFKFDVDSLLAEGKKQLRERPNRTLTPYHGAPTRNVYASTSSRR